MGSNTWKVLMIKFKLNQHSVFLFFSFNTLSKCVGNWHELGWDFAVKSKKHLIAYVIFHRFVCFQRNSGKGSPNVSLWLAYCAFHAGEYKRAMHEYEAMRDEGMKGWSNAAIRDTLMNLACCYFYLGMYTESEKVGSRLKNECHKDKIVKIVFCLKSSIYGLVVF